MRFMYDTYLVDNMDSEVCTGYTMRQWYKRAHGNMQLLYVTSRIWGEGELFAEGNRLSCYSLFLNSSEEEIEKLITASLKRLSPFLELRKD